MATNCLADYWHIFGRGPGSTGKGEFNLATNCLVDYWHIFGSPGPTGKGEFWLQVVWQTTGIFLVVLGTQVKVSFGYKLSGRLYWHIFGSPGRRRVLATNCLADYWHIFGSPGRTGKGEFWLQIVW